jgi:hypothetical protein
MKILQRITALQKEGNLKPSDLLLAFLDARVLPLQCRSYKMCFLGSARDPTRHSSRMLAAVEVAQKVNRIAEVKLPASWAWGLRPYDRSNPITEVCLSGLDSVSPPLSHWLLDHRQFGLGRTCLLCRPRRIWPHAKLVSPLTKNIRTTRSSGMTARRMMTPAPTSLLRVQAPPTVMMEVRSSKTRASPSATPVSSPVPPP